MLDVRRMRVLREVALRGSFSAAAESLSFTQSAVSQQIAALESAAATIMPVAIARFAEQHPAVELSLGLLEPEEAVAALRAGDIDLAATFGSGKPEDRGGDGVTHHHLLEDPMYLVMAADHPLARKRGVRL